MEANGFTGWVAWGLSRFELFGVRVLMFQGLEDVGFSSSRLEGFGELEAYLCRGHKGGQGSRLVAVPGGRGRTATLDRF